MYYWHKMSGRRNQSDCGQSSKLIPATLQSVSLKATLVQVALGLQCFFGDNQNDSFEHNAKNIKKSIKIFKNAQL